MTSEQYLQAFSNSLKIKSRSKRTHDNYISHLRTFLKSFPHNIQRATTAQLTEYISSKGSASTMAQVHTTLNLFYSLVLKQPNKVAKFIPYPEKEKRLPKVPTHEEMLKMIDAQTNTKHKLILRLLYSLGLRVSELCNLKWSDVKRETGSNPLSIHVHGKGAKDRYLPISKETADLLTAYCSEYGLKCNDKYHYIFGDEKPYSIRSVQKIVERAGYVIGWDNLHPHIFRHAFCIEQKKSGIDLGRLQELTGHNSLQSLRIYTGTDNLTAKLLL